MVQLRSYFGYIVLVGVFVMWGLKTGSAIAWWIALEVSSIMIYCIAASSGNSKSVESTALYFIASSCGSVVMVIGVVIPWVPYLLGFSESKVMVSFLFYVGWIIKMGVAPFGWLPGVLGCFGLLPSFFLLGPNKLLGLMVLCKLGSTDSTATILFIACAWNSVSCSIGTWRLSLMTGLLGYSSMAVTSWGVLIGMFQGLGAMSVFMGIYIISLWTLMMQLWIMEYTCTSDALGVRKATEVEIKSSVACICVLLSSLGFPMTFGFVLKVMTYSMVLPMGFLSVGVIMLFSSCLMVVWYLGFLFILALSMLKASSTYEEVKLSEMVWWAFIAAVPHLVISFGMLGVFSYFSMFGF